MKKELVYVEVRTNEDDAVGDLIFAFEKALKLFGLYLVDDPRCRGLDGIALLLSNRKITKKELQKIDQEEL